MTLTLTLALTLTSSREQVERGGGVLRGARAVGSAGQRDQWRDPA